MPRKDGIGLMGRGAMSGKSGGVCNGANAVCNGTGLRRGNRKGAGRNFGAAPVSKTQKELWQEQKERLESQLDIICKQLESL
ncbi:MAG: DUF5320 domain-containing protein [Desulfosporosinus sp.]|nr:DUF5320 domain-containing protein [Desulfosporosinus sp.]